MYSEMHGRYQGQWCTVSCMGDSRPGQWCTVRCKGDAKQYGLQLDARAMSGAMVYSEIQGRCQGNVYSEGTSVQI